MYKNKVGFCTGTGRCGTNFIKKLFELEENIASSHERNPLNETFHRYTKWYKLPIDDDGFKAQKIQEVNQDLERKHFSFEASPHLAFSILDLYEIFNSKFLILIRDPIDMVNSYHLKKSLYEKPYILGDSNLALGYQQNSEFHHFLGRIAPYGKEFNKWNNYTRVGKLAWWWKAINRRILDQLNQIPESNYRIVKIESFDYSKYQEVLGFFSLNETRVTNEEFLKISKKPPGSHENKRSILDWNEQEIEEFEFEAKSLGQELGYDTDCSQIKNRIEKSYFIKPGYKTQEQNLTLSKNRNKPYWLEWRIKMNGYFQYDVYKFAKKLIKAKNIKSVIDVGCGPAVKLMKIIRPVCSNITGVDQEEAVNYCKKNYRGGKFIVDDFENPKSLQNKFELIICADVIEHILNPDILLSYLSKLATPDSYIILSTPERDLHRGMDCMASLKPEHVREWNSTEFRDYLTYKGFEVIDQFNVPFIRNAFWVKDVRHNIKVVKQRTNGNINTTQLVVCKLRS